MKVILFLTMMLFNNINAFADVQSMINSWKRHNDQVMDLKKTGLFEIKQAAHKLTRILSKKGDTSWSR